MRHDSFDGMQEQSLRLHLAEGLFPIYPFPVHSLPNITVEHAGKVVPCNPFCVMSSDGCQGGNQTKAGLEVDQLLSQVCLSSGGKVNLPPYCMPPVAWVLMVGCLLPACSI